MSQFSVVRPFEISDDILISTDVAEGDYSAWDSGETCGLGDRRITVADHTIWESLAGSNLNHPPSTSAAWWVKVSKTNRWKLFDTSNSTQTAQAAAMTYTLRFGAVVTAVSALNLTGVTSMRVRVSDPVYGVVYDVTKDLSPLPATPAWWGWLFGIKRAPTNVVLIDLPAFPNADVIVDFIGSSLLAVGVLLFGQVAGFGLGIEYGAGVGIKDYSSKVTNQWGDTEFRPGAFAKRGHFSVTILKEEVDYLQLYLSDLRATPSLFIGTELYESTHIFGFYEDFETLINYAEYSDCSISLIGLT